MLFATEFQKTAAPFWGAAGLIVFTFYMLSMITFMNSIMKRIANIETEIPIKIKRILKKIFISFPFRTCFLVFFFLSFFSAPD